ncbi:MAG: hypothetical protein OHK0019_21380 [Saprospiraceae bacterium]
MSENPNERNQIPKKVIHEIVAFRYSDEASLMLVGEAEIMIEMLTDGDDESEIFTNIQAVRVDLLSVFDASDCDVFVQIMENPALKRILEEAALEHFFHPPKVPVSLPKRITEW